MHRLPRKTKRLEGQIFGRWRVLAFSHFQRRGNGVGIPYWFCVCECGTFRAVSAHTLRAGASRSCGCALNEWRRAKKPGTQFEDLTGQTFQWLTAVRYDHTSAQGRAVWACRCRCGRMRLCEAKPLKAGKILSCGCRPRKPYRNRNPYAATRHPLYAVWVQMRQRCCNTRHPGFSYYGGRGIRVCPEWSGNFWRFAHDMGPRPERYSVERLDVDGPYSPENCIWADARTQVLNRRISRSYKARQRADSDADTPSSTQQKRRAR